jgi:hypothetical protein
MTTGTNPETPSGSFEQYVARDPGLAGASAQGPAQTVELFANGTSIGWLGQNSGQWCVATGKDAAASIQPYVYDSVLYYQNATSSGRYLSVSDGAHYVGFYNWSGARGWRLDGDVLTSLYTNEQLSYWSSDNNYIYANTGSGYTPLTVRFH